MKDWIACSLLFSMAALGIPGCENPADQVPPAAVSDAKPVPPAAASPAQAAPAVTQTNGSIPPVAIASKAGAAITPENSLIEFIGSKVTGSHHGGFKSFKGTFEVVPSKIESSRINVEIDVNSIWADNGNLTNHLKSPDFFDVAKFSTASFVSTGIEPQSHDAKAKDATHTVTGNLTIHGVTKSVSFPAKITVSGETGTLESEFFINRKDFGIVYPGKANDLIRDEVVIKLAVHTPAGSRPPQEAATR